jgi:hypothetical protein
MTEVNSQETKVRIVLEDEDVKDKLKQIWKNVKNSNDMETALKTTIDLLQKQMENMIRAGLTAFHRYESCARELELLKDELAGQTAQVTQFRMAHENSTRAISVCSTAEWCRLFPSRCFFLSHLLLCVALSPTFSSKTESPSRSGQVSC